MPSNGYRAYLEAMDRQKDWRIDPQLAEAYSRRQERLNEAELARLRESGQIATRGIERMGDVLSSGLKNAYGEYKEGRQRGRDESFDKIKYDRLVAEDEYWNGLWDGEDIGGGGSSGSSRMAGNVGVGPGAQDPSQEVPDAGTIRQGLAEDDAPTYRQIKPAQSFSPGAVAVLEGRAKPGYNPAVKELRNPTLNYLQGETSTADYLGLNRMPQPAPRGQLTPASPTSSAQGAAPSVGTGSGYGTASAEEIGGGGTRPRGRKTRLQHKWDLGLIKSEEEIRQLRKGRNPNSRENPWKDTGKFDAEGHPIKFNTVTGEFAVDRSVTGAKPRDPGAMSDYQREQIALGREKLKQQGKGGNKGLTPYQQYQMGRNAELDQQRREDKKDAAEAKAKDKLDTRVTKYSEEMQQTGVPKALGQLEIIHGIMDKSEDVPGFGQTAALPDLMISREGQDLRQATQTLFNIELKDRSGAAVVDQELQRLKAEFGQGNWKTDRQLREGIRMYEKRLHEVIRNMNAGVDSSVADEYAARGGRDTRKYQPSPEEKWVKGKRYIRGQDPKTGQTGWVPAP